MTKLPFSRIISSHVSLLHQEVPSLQRRGDGRGQTPAVTMETFFAGEIATELVKELLKVVRRTYLCRPAAEQLKRSVDALLPIVQEIRHSGVELPQHRQSQLSELADQLRLALDLARKAAASPRWNVYRSMQLAHRMERLDRWISRWVERHMPAHVLADVHHLRVDYSARLDRIERTLDMTAASAALAAARVPVAVGSVPFSGSPLTEMMDGLVPAAAAATVPVAVGTAPSSGFPVAEMMEGLVLRGEGEKPVGVGIRVGKERVKEMLMAGGDRAAVVGISGIGGSGKTTLAKEICRDPQIRSKGLRGLCFISKLFLFFFFLGLLKVAFGNLKFPLSSYFDPLLPSGSKKVLSFFTSLIQKSLKEPANYFLQ